MSHKQDQNDADSFGKWATWTLFIVVPLWFFMGLLALNIKNVVGLFSAEAAGSIEPGTFGDMFGAANALFSALAFAVIVITMWLQVKELKESRLDRKTNLEHQEVIARSQEAAAEMQLLVAQSGAVFTAYLRVFGADFAARFDRLKWVVQNISPEHDSDTLADQLEAHNLLAFFATAPSDPPAHYNASLVRTSEMSQQSSGDVVVAQRVHEDIESCADAILDLWPAYNLGLIDLAAISAHEALQTRSTWYKCSRVCEWLEAISNEESERLQMLKRIESEMERDFNRYMKEEFGDDLSIP